MRDPTLNKSDDGAMLHCRTITKTKERWSLKVRNAAEKDSSRSLLRRRIEDRIACKEWMRHRPGCSLAIAGKKGRWAESICDDELKIERM